jgi:2TM domain
MTTEQPTNQKDTALWELAKKRASFKSHFTIYCLVNIFLWLIWYFTSYKSTYANINENIPWPIWPTLGWGLAIAIQYFGAYISPKSFSVENEYQKLKNK